MSALAEENTLLAAENARLAQEVQRQAQMIVALEDDPAHLLARTCLQDDTDPTFYHVIHGSKEGLSQVKRVVQATWDLKACRITLQVAVDEMARQLDRGDRFEAALLQEQSRSEAAEARVAELERQVPA